MVTHHQPLQRGDGRLQPAVAPAPEQPVGDLIRQLGTEGRSLLRHEVALAKLEMREMAREVALDSARVFGAIALAVGGVMTLLAAAIVALGNALDGRYALSALIIGIVILVVGALLARRGIAGLKQPPMPDHTVATLKSTTDWVKEEISDLKEFKDEIRL
jgi:uncharacterized membrane protein YqjE